MKSTIKVNNISFRIGRKYIYKDRDCFFRGEKHEKLTLDNVAKDELKEIFSDDDLLEAEVLHKVCRVWNLLDSYTHYKAKCKYLHCL